MSLGRPNDFENSKRVARVRTKGNL